MNEESIAGAVKDAADAEAESSKHIAEAAKAESSKHIAEAAEAATAAAMAAKALAETDAAQTIQKNEGEIEWLRQHATQTENSLKELHQNQRELASSIPSMLEESQGRLITALKEQLTPPPSPEPEPLTPQQESEAEAARKEAEEKKKPRTGPKYKANWM